MIYIGLNKLILDHLKIKFKIVDKFTPFRLIKLIFYLDKRQLCSIGANFYNYNSFPD